MLTKSRCNEIVILAKQLSFATPSVPWRDKLGIVMTTEEQEEVAEHWEKENKTSFFIAFYDFWMGDKCSK